MATSRRPCSEEVDQLLLNAQLRDELEPFLDEAVTSLNVAELPTPVENEILASMLAWERAPVLPIAQWFDPELLLPAPELLDDDQLHALLWETIGRLFHARIVLDFTDHLSDRELYTLILRDILPAHEKKIEGTDHYLHWDCADAGGDPETWLRYYASEEERAGYFESCGEPLPPVEPPPFPRNLPQRPL